LSDALRWIGVGFLCGVAQARSVHGVSRCSSSH
jgi:hypothetical protein